MASIVTFFRWPFLLLSSSTPPLSTSFAIFFPFPGPVLCSPVLPHISGLDCDLDSAGDFDRCDFDFEAPLSSPHLSPFHPSVLPFLSSVLAYLPYSPYLQLSHSPCPPYQSDYLPYALLPALLAPPAYSPFLLSSLSFCDFVVFGFPWRCGRVFPMIVCHLFCYKP